MSGKPTRLTQRKRSEERSLRIRKRLNSKRTSRMMSPSSQLACEETLSERRPRKNRSGCAMLQLLFVVMNLLFTSWPNSVAGKCKAIISVAKNGQVCYVGRSLAVFGANQRLIRTCSGRGKRPLSSCCLLQISNRPFERRRLQ